MFRKLRIAILLAVMFGVAADAWLTHARSVSWKSPLWVYVYPIAGDNSPATAQYLARLGDADYAPIDLFLAREARRYGVALAQPVQLMRRRTLSAQPPAPPFGGNIFQVMHWSLGLRWWARSAEGGQPGPPANIRMFVIYHDPQVQRAVAHSLGLQKGMIGVVHAFASAAQTGSNNVIVAHELLHTLGATDKYDPRSGLPVFPAGYADPTAEPRYPQARAELMGGRVPLSPVDAQTPRDLDAVVVGADTAREIGWVR